MAGWVLQAAANAEHMLQAKLSAAAQKAAGELAQAREQHDLALEAIRQENYRMENALQQKHSMAQELEAQLCQLQQDLTCAAS